MKTCQVYRVEALDQMQRVTGSERNTGILVACEKDTGARVVYSADPEQLIDESIRVYCEAHYRQPSVFSAKEPKLGTERDVVCGMSIEPGSAVGERTWNGKRYRFCSTACAAQFDAAPQRYQETPHAHG